MSVQKLSDLANKAVVAQDDDLLLLEHNATHKSIKFSELNKPNTDALTVNEDNITALEERTEGISSEDTPDRIGLNRLARYESTTIPSDDQDLTNKLYVDSARSEAASEDPWTTGYLRSLKMGTTYIMKVTQRELVPQSGILTNINELVESGIRYTGSPLIDAVLIRTGTQTWSVISQEWTGTTHQPIVIWHIDVDPAYGDHSGIGSTGALSFNSLILDLENDIGNAAAFGAESIVEKIISLENQLDADSIRIANIEHSAASAHTPVPAHVDVVEDWLSYVSNQGTHYVMLRDDPNAEGHVGVLLFDGQPHKVRYEWLPGFDPHHFEDPIGSGNWIDWDTTEGTVWVDGKFKKLVNPSANTIVEYQTLVDFIKNGSILTVQWNDAINQMDLLKVEHGTAHVAPLDTASFIRADGSIPMQEGVVVQHLGHDLGASTWQMYDAGDFTALYPPGKHITLSGSHTHAEWDGIVDHSFLGSGNATAVVFTAAPPAGAGFGEINVLSPEAYVHTVEQDIATKKYVDDIEAGDIRSDGTTPMSDNIHLIRAITLTNASNIDIVEAGDFLADSCLQMQQVQRRIEKWQVRDFQQVIPI